MHRKIIVSAILGLSLLAPSVASAAKLPYLHVAEATPYALSKAERLWDEPVAYTYAYEGIVNVDGVLSHPKSDSGVELAGGVVPAHSRLSRNIISVDVSRSWNWYDHHSGCSSYPFRGCSSYSWMTSESQFCFATILVRKTKLGRIKTGVTYNDCI